jgi:hypothetical protein
MRALMLTLRCPRSGNDVNAMEAFGWTPVNVLKCCIQANEKCIPDESFCCDNKQCLEGDNNEYKCMEPPTVECDCVDTAGMCDDTADKFCCAGLVCTGCVPVLRLCWSSCVPSAAAV